MNNIRVMHIVNVFDPRRGYEEFYLAKKQVEYGLNVSIVTSDRYGYGNRKWAPGSRTIEGIKVHRLRSLFKFRGNVWPLKPSELAKLIKSFHPQIVHCHGLLSPLSIEALLLKDLFRYKMVGDVITGDSPLTFVLLPKFKVFFNLWISRNVDAFFACTKAVEEFLIRNMNIPQKKVHFIPLAADHELFKLDNSRREKTRSRLGLSPEDIVAIYTGKFLPSKRIHDLLMSSKPIIKANRRFKILLVGDGPEHYKEKLKSMVSELGIAKNVLIIRTVHRRDLPNFYNAADFAVWPGIFSISIIEAMACGLPVIIAKSDWTSHYLEYENGFCFRAGDVITLASLLSKLIQDDELRRAMGKRSRKLVEDRLNYDKTTNQYIEVYKEIL